jgi:hypothetical protein
VLLHLQAPQAYRYDAAEHAQDVVAAELLNRLNRFMVRNRLDAEALQAYMRR